MSWDVRDRDGPIPYILEIPTWPKGAPLHTSVCLDASALIRVIALGVLVARVAQRGWLGLARVA